MRKMFAVKLFTVQKFLLVLFCLINLIHGQYEHKAVLENDAQEAYLPYHYRNPFLQSPQFRQAIHWTTWFHPGEQHVQDRETDRISRHAIFNVLSHAGLVQRHPRRFFYR